MGGIKGLFGGFLLPRAEREGLPDGSRLRARKAPRLCLLRYALTQRGETPAARALGSRSRTGHASAFIHSQIQLELAREGRVGLQQMVVAADHFVIMHTHERPGRDPRRGTRLCR